MNCGSDEWHRIPARRPASEAAVVDALLWTAVAFLAGSLPLSVWLGRLALQTDIQRYGDGNPGAANVWRAGGGYIWSGLAILLDGLKGAIPVGLASFGLALQGWPLTAVALAPVLGHAFSPFLRFKGGKALAVTFGVWTGLTLWRGPLVLGLLFAFWLMLVTVEGWAVVFGMSSFIVYLVVTSAGDVLLMASIGNGLILAWKHRHDLRSAPRLRLSMRP